MRSDGRQERVVCPYCGAPGNYLDGICPNCGNEVDPNRLFANPVGSAWRNMQALRRVPVEGEPNTWLVRAGLAIIGLVLFLPSLLGLIAWIRSSAGALTGRIEMILLFGLLTFAGITFLRHAFQQRKHSG